MSAPAKPRVGRAFTATVWIECPYCGGDVAGEDGSLSIGGGLGYGDTLRCLDCDRECVRPRKARS